MTSVYALQSCFFKPHFNIILPSMSGSAKWSFPQPFPLKPYCISLFHVCYLFFISHIPIFLDLITLLVFGVEYKYMKLHSWQFSPVQILSATSCCQHTQPISVL
jgi:hypothetical protein